MSFILKLDSSQPSRPYSAQQHTQLPSKHISEKFPTTWKNTYNLSIYNGNSKEFL